MTYFWATLTLISGTISWLCFYKAEQIDLLLKKAKEWISDKKAWLKTFNHRPRVTIRCHSIDVKMLDNLEFIKINGRLDFDVYVEDFIDANPSDGICIFGVSGELLKDKLETKIEVGNRISLKK